LKGLKLVKIGLLAISANWMPDSSQIALARDLSLRVKRFLMSFYAFDSRVKGKGKCLLINIEKENASN